MKHSTLVALMAIYDSDPARTRSDRETLQKLFGLMDAALVSKPVERVISFEEAAKRLNRTTRTVHLLARRGVLRMARMVGPEEEYRTPNLMFPIGNVSGVAGLLPSNVPVR